MTDKMTMMGIPSDLKLRTSQVASVCGAVPAVLLACVAVFAEESADVIHFIDSNTDRTPAVTAFPRYPSVARRDRIEGEATVCFKIRADGKISRPVVTERTHKIFAKPSLRAIKKSNFEPIRPGQILSSTRTCRTYRFRLDPVVVSRVEKDGG